MDAAARNRQIKQVLARAFGAGKVSVRGSRGTAWGWVTVSIDWTPLDTEQAREMRALCFQLLGAAKVDLGRTYTDDTCQFETSKCHIDFNQARYFRTHRHSDGSLAVQREYMGEWEG